MASGGVFLKIEKMALMYDFKQSRLIFCFGDKLRGAVAIF